MWALVLLLPLLARGVTIATITTTAGAASRTSIYLEQTATINGFTDFVIDEAPECSKQCLIDMNPSFCPYWDTGCLSVMVLATNPLGKCIASNCKGADVDSFTSIANSVCNSRYRADWEVEASVVLMLESSARVGRTSSSTSTTATTSASTTGSTTVTSTLSSSAASSKSDSTGTSSSSSTPSSTSGTSSSSSTPISISSSSAAFGYSI